MTSIGASGFWVYLMCVMVVLGAYVAWRMTQRVSLYAGEDDYDATAYAPISPSATPVAVEVASEYYAENADTESEETGDVETSLGRM